MTTPQIHRQQCLEIMALKTRLNELEGELRRLEWAGPVEAGGLRREEPSATCPDCKSRRADGHNSVNWDYVCGLDSVLNSPPESEER